MGMFTNVIVIALILFGIYWFFPDQFNFGRSYLADLIGQNENLEYTVTDYGKDFGEPGDEKCSTNQDCEDYFRINYLRCSSQGTCYIPK